MNTFVKLTPAAHSENLNEILATLSPERRAEVEKVATELAMNPDIHKAAEILEKSQSLDDAKFVGELGWLTVLAATIAIVAI